jgi:hypothetical protein
LNFWRGQTCYITQEVAPPYEVIDEKKALDADPVVDNRA